MYSEDSDDENDEQKIRLMTTSGDPTLNIIQWDSTLRELEKNIPTSYQGEDFSSRSKEHAYHWVKRPSGSLDMGIWVDNEVLCRIHLINKVFVDSQDDCIPLDSISKVEYDGIYLVKLNDGCILILYICDENGEWGI